MTSLEEERAENTDKHLLPRNQRDMLDIAAKDIFLCIRMYDNLLDRTEKSKLQQQHSLFLEGNATTTDSNAAKSDHHNRDPTVLCALPIQRIVSSVQDFLVSFGKVGARRRKVLGSWISSNKPRDVHQPMLRCALLAYEDPPLPIAIYSQSHSDNNSRSSNNINDYNIDNYSKSGDESAAPSDEISDNVAEKDSTANEENSDNGTKVIKTASVAVLEHRLYVRILPLRCYLDEQLVSFAKGLASTTTAPLPRSVNKDESVKNHSSSSGINHEVTPSTAAGAAAAVNNEKRSGFYFQCIMVTATEIKIDYRASGLNIQALHSGDYLQLLNIFPLDGLEITLKHVKLHGIAGLQACIDRMLETWVKDIYANQLHRVISGTAPFRGLSNIGNDLHELMLIPLRDYRRSASSGSHHHHHSSEGGNAIKHLRRGTQALIRTVTRETLHASSKLTMFVANAITELASDTPPPLPPIQSHHSNNDQKQLQQLHSRQNTASVGQQQLAQATRRQPSGVVEGLEQAYASVSRELGSATETVVAIPIRQYIQSGSGPGGYLKSVIRALPIAVLRPMAGIAEGISYTMLGLRNNVDPAARIDEEDVWNVDIFGDYDDNY